MNRYRAGAFEEPQLEVARLAAQAAAISTEEHALLAGLGLPERGRALDVGCGPGFFAGGMRRARPELRVVGVDVDPFVLPQALAALPVVRGDVAALPFAERVFDLVYSRLFLRHVPRPGRSLRAMARLVRPGGWVAAIDGSDASLRLTPRPPGFGAIVAARARWFRDRRCSGDVGQRLPGLMVKAGLQTVRTASLQVDTALIGPEAFSRIVLGPFLQAAAEVLSDPPVLADARQAVQRWTTQPAAFGAITLFVAAGQVGSPQTLDGRSIA